MKHKGFNESNRRDASLQMKNNSIPEDLQTRRAFCPTNRAAGGHDSAEEAVTGARHLACHQVIRVMGDATPPFRSSYLLVFSFFSYFIFYFYRPSYG